MTNNCNREAIAWLAAGTLEPAEADGLRRHIAQCPRCREHLAAVSAVCAEHQSAASGLPEARLPGRVHHRVATAIRGHGAAHRESRWNFPWLAGLGAASALGILLLLLLGLPAWLRPTLDNATQATDPNREGTSATRTAIPVPIPEADPVDASGIGNTRVLVFRDALLRSEEAFDRLLDAGHGPSAGREPGSYRPGSVRSNLTL